MVARYLLTFLVSAALHVLAALLVGAPASEPPAQADARQRAIAAFVASPAEDPSFPGLRPLGRAAAPPFDVGASSSVAIGDFRMDVAKIASQARVLFPFVTPGLAVDQFFPGVETDNRVLFEAAPAARRRPAAAAARPLLMSDAALQSVADKSWARRDRWQAFQRIRRLAETHDPNEGRLPDLLNEYWTQNALQPYTDADIRDPRLWVQLGLASDHAAFIGFIRRYASDHPSTRATTELLFLLDRIAEANRDALAVLLDSDPAEMLAATRQANARAYDLIVRIRSE